MSKSPHWQHSANHNVVHLRMLHVVALGKTGEDVALAR
jgi:hypothetical protein